MCFGVCAVIIDNVVDYRLPHHQYAVRPVLFIHTVMLLSVLLGTDWLFITINNVCGMTETRNEGKEYITV